MKPKERMPDKKKRAPDAGVEQSPGGLIDLYSKRYGACKTASSIPPEIPLTLRNDLSDLTIC